MNDGDDLLAVNDVEGAMKAYGDAAKMLPGNPEIRYWAAITMLTSGREKEGLAYLKQVFAANPNWVEVTRRLPAAGLLPDDPALMEKILGVAPRCSSTAGADAAAPSGAVQVDLVAADEFDVRQHLRRGDHALHVAFEYTLPPKDEVVRG